MTAQRVSDRGVFEVWVEVEVSQLLDCPAYMAGEDMIKYVANWMYRWRVKAFESAGIVFGCLVSW